ncbi:hypothetical protein TNCV_1631731 [Trichonephila clavipes]|nr:hypothetical protein TNCV_1631731 [Trichonephila clavipes]
MVNSPNIAASAKLATDGATYAILAPNVGDACDHGNPAPGQLPSGNPSRYCNNICIGMYYCIELLFSYVPDFARPFYFSIILASGKRFLTERYKKARAGYSVSQISAFMQVIPICFEREIVSVLVVY